MPDQILPLYGIQPAESSIELFGDGLINRTWKVNTKAESYILQQINQTVFKNPFQTDQNIMMIKSFLNETAPDYLFVAPIPAISGESLVRSQSEYFRLFPFIKNSHSLNVLKKKEEAEEAAKQFGKFSRLLNDFDVRRLHVTLPDFHNLSLRFNQFINAVEGASSSTRKEKSKECISFIMENEEIVHIFKNMVENKEIPKRVIHHDTKISNVLFDDQHKAICIIDLDTVMPGYFISDVGDMMRTYLSSVNEEERDLSKINIRKDFFKHIYEGYIHEMGDVLTEKEKTYFVYSGKFLIYMQAIRFITDFLNNDIYYGQLYEDQNLYRAKNQLKLLNKYLVIEDELEAII